MVFMYIHNFYCKWSGRMGLFFTHFVLRIFLLTLLFYFLFPQDIYFFFKILMTSFSL